MINKKDDFMMAKINTRLFCANRPALPRWRRKHKIDQLCACAISWNLCCDGLVEFTVDECFKSLQLFENNKSPGEDGLTVEFYKTFWNTVGNLMVESLNYSYDHGELSSSQKRAIITLIEKKDKDRRNISNWRPISLINVDVKIGSKAIAKRLEAVLPKIIHHNQCAYVLRNAMERITFTILDVLSMFISAGSVTNLTCVKP